MTTGGPGPQAGLLDDRRLYLCTGDRPDLERFIAACVRGGVDVVQLRDKTLEDRPLLTRASLALHVCRELGVPFIMNDRPDLALESGADGVHVGQDDAPPALARRILGPHALIGLSTHAPVEVERARREPIDYLSAGPVAETPTKPGRPGTGLGYAGTATRNSQLPVFVTGGVNPGNIEQLVAAGARRFVVVRALTEADDPERMARRLRETVDRALAGT